MEVRETIAVWIDREPTREEEIGALDEEDIFEMANLGERHTGIPGVIFISTVMGSHGPRVKYYAKTGSNQPSFSVAIASQPRVLANSMDDRDLNRMAPVVLEWVRLNHEALASFWWEGKFWQFDEVEAFVAGLAKV
jgi:hypothetical protein